MDSSAIARQLGDPRELLVGLDFDGVLSPIVADPQSARIHPLGPDLLVRLAQAVRRVAIITGRPAASACTSLNGTTRWVLPPSPNTPATS